MSLSGEYLRQRAWRDWERVLDALPLPRGARVLDLGCGVGDQAALFAARGARVVGVDANDELLDAARARGIAGLELLRADLRALPELGPADGIWSSFVAAYFPGDLAEVLRSWRRQLRPGGWIALGEVDDLFGHEPVAERTRALLDSYARDALEGSRYDFRAGGKLRAALERAGFAVTAELELADRELACGGPLGPDVIEGWRSRLERMELLKRACGGEYESVRDDFLACLARPDHATTARVVCCLATRGRREDRIRSGPGRS